MKETTTPSVPPSSTNESHVAMLSILRNAMLRTSAVLQLCVVLSNFFLAYSFPVHGSENYELIVQSSGWVFIRVILIIASMIVSGSQGWVFAVSIGFSTMLSLLMGLVVSYILLNMVT